MGMYPTLISIRTHLPTMQHALLPKKNATRENARCVHCSRHDMLNCCVMNHAIMKIENDNKNRIFANRQQPTPADDCTENKDNIKNMCDRF